MFDSNFCIDTNIPSCFQILASELELLDIPVTAYKEGDNKILVYLLNVAWSLVTNRKRQSVRINEQNEIILNLNEKINSLEDNKKNNIYLLENERKKNLSLSDSLTQVITDKDKCISEIKELKKEIKSLQAMLNNQQLQFEHDIRRKSCLIEDLQAKLLKLFGPNSKRNSDRHVSRNTSNVPVVEHGKLANKCLLNLQNHIPLFVRDNVTLRHSILTVHLL